MIGWRELLIILVIVIVVFGTKKLANIGKDLGGAIGGFKQGLKDGEQNARIANESDAKPVEDAKAQSGSRGDGNPG